MNNAMQHKAGLSAAARKRRRREGGDMGSVIDRAGHRSDAVMSVVGPGVAVHATREEARRALFAPLQVRGSGWAAGGGRRVVVVVVV